MPTPSTHLLWTCLHLPLNITVCTEIHCSFCFFLAEGRAFNKKMAKALAARNLQKTIFLNIQQRGSRRFVSDRGFITVPNIRSKPKFQGQRTTLLNSIISESTGTVCRDSVSYFQFRNYQYRSEVCISGWKCYLL